MANNWFYIDSTQGKRISYGQLRQDIAAIESVPEVLAFEDCYGLFVTLLAAIQRNTDLILVDDATAFAEAESWLAQQSTAQAHHPWPLSPEYRGERRKDSGRSAGYSFLTSSCRVGLFTSGTTGRPKLVLHAVDSLTRAVRISEKHAGDVWGLAYHPAHFAGLQVFFQALCNRNPVVRLFGLGVEQMHSAIKQQAITHLSATPTLMRLLDTGNQVHAGVQRVTLGGERIETKLISRLSHVFPHATFRNVYASTEVGSVLASDGELFRIPKQYQGLIKIVGDELAVHRTLLAASLQALGSEDYFLTGDCVEVVEQDPLTFRLISRRSDFINVGGYKVNPHEVEALLNAMPEVKESIVYGQANSVTGNLVCCDLVLNVDQKLTTKELIARLSSSLPAYKIPRLARVVDCLPVTTTGKRLRT